ncbi:MAG: T9SS type A sorting domain-containing protein [Brumimicrobium sp.]|nr:T9SS type A sorting domain-containing protein [Brumimicrobium sp.]
MKNIFYIVLMSISFPLFSQQWVTVNGEYIHNYLPFNQFTINPYTNNMWLVNPFNATVIEPDGSLTTFGENELGTLWQSDKLNFGFTPDHIFFTKELTGLYLFDNYEKQLLYADNDFQKIYFDEDTLFLTRFNGYLLKYTYGVGAENTSLSALRCTSKNGFLYIDRGSYYFVENGVDSPLWTDPYYLGGPSDVMEFDNESDTVYLGFINGITKCYDGVCYDTITPYNTTGMPSPNILEIEFDADNNLWVAFGDTNDEHIALGKLEGSTWTEVYTSANSPINFDRFYGFEFDTLGNIWVASDKNLHTIENINSPAWLSTKEFVMDAPRLSIYPNPASDVVHVQLPQSVTRAVLSIRDMNGKVVQEQTLDSSEMIQFDLSRLERGIYILNVVSDENQWQERLVKQ